MDEAHKAVVVLKKAAELLNREGFLRIYGIPAFEHEEDRYIFLVGLNEDIFIGF